MPYIIFGLLVGALIGTFTTTYQLDLDKRNYAEACTSKGGVPVRYGPDEQMGCFQLKQLEVK